MGWVRKRSRTDPKCKSCAFQCENPTEDKLHIVQTDDMGKLFNNIKERTNDDRACHCYPSKYGGQTGDTIGNYEMTVTPRSLFATDQTLLIPSDKSSFMKEVEQYSPPPPLCKLGNNHSTTAICNHAAPIDPEQHSRADSTEMHLGVDMLTEDMPEPPQIDRDNVIIIDGQGAM